MDGPNACPTVKRYDDGTTIRRDGWSPTFNVFASDGSFAGNRDTVKQATRLAREVRAAND